MTQTNEERSLADNKYINGRRGFIVTKISDVFKPSHYRVREGRNTCWKPDCTKEDVYQKVMNYIIIMQVSMYKSVFQIFFINLNIILVFFLLSNRVFILLTIKVAFIYCYL